MGSIWGKQLKISIFGESHGTEIGIVIDGFPAGYRPDMDFIHREIERRAPGQSHLTTQRKEKDEPIIVSGMLGGMTTGAPLCTIIYNEDTRSKDYSYLQTLPRPSHSEYTGGLRYRSYNDIRGGGHFSGRLTAPFVFAGALCKGFLLEKHGIEIGSHIFKVGSVSDTAFDLCTVDHKLLKTLQQMTLPLINHSIEAQIKNEVEAARKDQDSIGGTVECAIVGVEAGIGSPIFENVESRLASILYSIPAVKGVEFGIGFDFSEKRGSQVNDCLEMQGDQILTKTNNCGGVSGGITTGMPIVFKAAFKPTPSISKEQTTLNIENGKQEILKIQGRHDPCIAMRAPVVVEAAAAIAVVDLYLEAYGYDAE